MREISATSSALSTKVNLTLGGHLFKELNEYCLIGLHLHWKDAVNKDVTGEYTSATDSTLFIQLIAGVTNLSCKGCIIWENYNCEG